MTTALRTCTACKQDLPEDSFYVLKTGPSAGRVKSMCKACDNSRARAYQAANAERIREYQRAYRDENREMLNEKQRARAVANPDRVREIRRAHREANREQLNARSRSYHAANKQRASETARAWKAANSERFKAKSRAWREANRDRRRKNLRAWAVANPEKAIENVNRRRARKMNAPEVGTIDRQAIIERDKSICYLCGIVCAPLDPDGPRIHLDHVVPLARGGAHTAENHAVACQTCNLRKGGRLLSELGWLASTHS